MVVVESTIDPAEFGPTGRALTPAECAELAQRAARLVDLGSLERDEAGSTRMLWRTADSEAWLNTWWSARDSGFHDHDGSSGGVYVLEGSVTSEALVVGAPRRVREFLSGDAFSFGGNAIHRVDHRRGAVTIHVYSPPLRSIGHYELHDGELHRAPGSPDEISPPSESLTATLGS